MADDSERPTPADELRPQQALQIAHVLHRFTVD